MTTLSSTEEFNDNETISAIQKDSRRYHHWLSTREHILIHTVIPHSCGHGNGSWYAHLASLVMASINGLIHDDWLPYSD